MKGAVTPMHSHCKLTYRILSGADYGLTESQIAHPGYTDEEFFEEIERLADQGYLVSKRLPSLGLSSGCHITGITAKGKEYLTRLSPAII
jgi:hypothetical protein